MKHVRYAICLAVMALASGCGIFQDIPWDDIIPKPDPVVTNAPPIPDPVVTNTPPQPPVPTNTPPVVDGWDWGKVDFLSSGDRCASATEDVRLSSASHNGSTVRLSYSPNPVPWAVTHGDKNVAGDTYMFRKFGERWKGGKFDHLGVGQTVKTTGNINGGYNGHTVPKSGEVVAWVLVSDNRKQRSNVVLSQWK